MSPAATPTVADWIASLQHESTALVQAAGEAGLALPVPSCPGWTVRELIQHLGGVHRWATAHVAQQREEAMAKHEAAALMASHPSDRGLLSWFAAGAEVLIETLTTAPADLHCWTFLPARTPIEFWARRQAHETEIHRADVELARGGPKVTFEKALASDGIEELLFGFARRVRHLDVPSEIRLGFGAEDLPQSWGVRLSAQGVHAEHTVEAAQCWVRGSASEIYLLLWNRLPAGALEVSGTPDGLELWKRSVQVNWS
ncbi:MAG: maleylpyruvate isomerase family mycothiol-dependent enzyme [Candidatus Dormiibacterota bacterium]